MADDAQIAEILARTRAAGVPEMRRALVLAWDVLFVPQGLMDRYGWQWVYDRVLNDRRSETKQVGRRLYAFRTCEAHRLSDYPTVGDFLCAPDAGSERCYRGREGRSATYVDRFWIESMTFAEDWVAAEAKVPRSKRDLLYSVLTNACILVNDWMEAFEARPLGVVGK